MHVQTLKLGTRRSLLAWAQSGWVARQIEKRNPGIQVELVGIDTRGDKIVDVSLRNVVGKEFFVAELDDALQSGAVDLTVHSMKDLSLDRPPAFELVAIPPRENPRDVILFGPGILDKIAAGKTLKIGTSSPRRLENIPPFLAQALPRLGDSGAHGAKVDLVEIRGNVNTRLSRVHELESSERALDGVVLAFAGLIRLWADGPGREELSKLLTGVRWMVMPLKECPAAPAQGALAIECRASTSERDAEVRAAVRKMHDESTATRVSAERQILADWGGGCHQKFGATAVGISGMGSSDSGHVLYIRGRKPDQTFVEEVRCASLPEPLEVAPKDSHVWDGQAKRAGSGKKEESAIEGLQLPELEGRAVFIAHSRALPDSWAKSARGARVWTSGTASWYRLAAQGVWVEGCAEGFGFDSIRGTLQTGVLGLPEFGASWMVLTHDGAREDWSRAQVVATYRVYPQAPAAEDLAKVRQGRYFFWSSGSQFDQYHSAVGPGSFHFCGPGKTAQHLRALGVEPVVFPSTEEWRKWLKI